MAINPVGVADSISKLSVTDVTIWDLDQMKNEVQGRDCTVVMPAPIWFAFDDTERVNLGTGTSARWDFAYILSYRLFYKEVGTERNLGHLIPGLATKTFAFIDAIFANDSITGAIDMELASTPIFGVVEDPTGKAFWGADIDIRVLEFIN